MENEFYYLMEAARLDEAKLLKIYKWFNKKGVKRYIYLNYIRQVCEGLGLKTYKNKYKDHMQRLRILDENPAIIKFLKKDSRIYFMFQKDAHPPRPLDALGNYKFFNIELVAPIFNHNEICQYFINSHLAAEVKLDTHYS